MVARQLSQQGMDALDRGQIEEAEQHFADALNRCPANVNARCKLADCLWKRGASYDAIDHLSEALAMSGHDDTQILVRLGQMKLDVGDIGQAQQLVGKALHSSPDDPAAWQLHGSIRYQQGHYLESLASYQRSLSHDPDNVETQLAIAEIYHHLDRPGRTLSTLMRVERSVPPSQRSQRLLVLKGTAFNRLQRHEEAADALVMAINAGEPTSELMEQLAVAQFHAGQYQQARQTIRNALPLASAEQNKSLQRLMTQIAATENVHEFQVR